MAAAHRVLNSLDYFGKQSSVKEKNVKIFQLHVLTRTLLKCGKKGELLLLQGIDNKKVEMLKRQQEDTTFNQCCESTAPHMR